MPGAIQVKTAEQWVEEGNQLFVNKDFQNAILCYEEALLFSAVPSYADILANYGACLYALGKLEEAKEKFEKCISIKSNSPVAHSTLGFVLRDIGKAQRDPAAANIYFQVAVNHFSKAMQLEKPPTVKTACAFASLLRDMGEYKRAIKVYGQALEVAVNDPDVLGDMGITFFYMAEKASGEEKTGFFTAALKNIEVGLKHHPNHSGLLFRRGVLQYSQKQYHEAAQTFLAALKHNSTDAETWYHLGLAYHATAQYEEAKRAYHICLSFTSSHVSAREKYTEVIQIIENSLTNNNSPLIFSGANQQAIAVQEQDEPLLDPQPDLTVDRTVRVTHYQLKRREKAYLQEINLEGEKRSSANPNSRTCVIH